MTLEASGVMVARAGGAARAMPATMAIARCSGWRWDIEDLRGNVGRERRSIPVSRPAPSDVSDLRDERGVTARERGIRGCVLAGRGLFWLALPLPTSGRNHMEVTDVQEARHFVRARRAAPSRRPCPGP